MENEQALELFPARLQHLSQLSWEERMVQACLFHTVKWLYMCIQFKVGITSFKLAIGFLAGNVFDWGAKEVALLMEEGNLVSQIFVHNEFHFLYAFKVK